MPAIEMSGGFVVAVDPEDADLAQHRWFATRSSADHPYAQRNDRARGRGAKVYMHREIAERMRGPIPKGYVVDHIDGDVLNNTRANLRVVTQRENLWNQKRPRRHSRSGVIGVRQEGGRWVAYITQDMKKRHLGRFDTMEEARAARLRAEAERLERAAA